MTRIEKSVIISAPVDKVFAFATDWRNIANYFVYVHEVNPTTQETVGDGARFAVRLKFLGRMMNSEWEFGEYKENEGVMFITPLMGITATKRWRFTAVEGSTRVNFALEYKPSPPLLGPLLDILLFKGQWNKLSEKTIQNLKQLIETQMATTPPPFPKS